MANLVALQMVSSPDVEQNLRAIERQLASLAISTDTLVVLPECFACFGATDKALLHMAEEKGNGPVQAELAELAKRYGVWIVAGSLPLQCDTEDKFTASCLIFDSTGKTIAEYQKIHLFDVQVADNTGQYRESRYTEAGNQVVVVEATPFGTLGIAICYDIRFPGLFQAMGDIDVLALPAAFTNKTGQAHWHPLLAARSIEKQCYLVAANQGGTHENGRQTFGHSSIYSPWGKLLVEHPLGEACVQASVDSQLLTQIRRSMPVGQQNRFRSELA